MRPSRSSPRSRPTPRGAERIVAFGVLALAVGSALVPACDEKKPGPASAPAASASAEASVRMPPPTSASTVSPPPPPPVRYEGPCRILEGGGPLKAWAPGSDAGAPYRAGSLLKRGEALELGPEGVATVKDPESGRELRFEGPGLAVPCAGTDETWLLSGTLVMRPGTADQPLAELSVVVREGVVLLTSGAYVRVTSKPTGTELRVSARRPSVWLAKDAKAEWTARGTGDAGAQDLALLTAAPKVATAAFAKAECDTLTKESGDLAAQMMSKDASLGDLSPKSLVAEKNARAACAVAKLRAFR